MRGDTKSRSRSTTRSTTLGQHQSHNHHFDFLTPHISCRRGYTQHTRVIDAYIGALESSPRNTLESLLARRQFGSAPQL